MSDAFQPTHGVDRLELSFKLRPPAAFYAVDTVTGQVLWQTHTGDQVFHWLPAIVEDKVFFATDDGNFQALAAQTGTNWML